MRLVSSNAERASYLFSRELWKVSKILHVSVGKCLLHLVNFVSGQGLLARLTVLLQFEATLALS